MAGCVVLIDEGNEPEFMPLDAGKPAEWIAKLVKNRREGMGFWLTTVHPSLFSGYVRKLIDHHVHCVRKFNTNVIQRYQWGRCMDACEKGAAQKTAVASVGTLDAHVFALYKSANAHNMKRRIPKKVYLLGLAVVVAIGAAITAPILIKRAQSRNVALIGGSMSEKNGSRAASQGLRVNDYPAWVKPRIVGMPWTAPAYDSLPVKSDPRVYCIAVEDGTTHCISEQGTTLEIPSATARLIAASGIYNPFAAPPLDAYARQEPPATDGKPQARPALGAMPQQGMVQGTAQGVGGGLRKESPMRGSYVPPETTAAPG